MSTPKDPIRMVVERAILLERLSNQIARDSSGVLRELFDEIAAAIARIDPTGVSVPRYRRDRVAKLVDRVESLARETYPAVHRDLRGSLARLGALEGRHTADILVATLGPAGNAVKFAPPTVNMMKTILDTNPFQGETLAGWSRVQEQGLVRRVRQQVQIGMSAEESIDQLVRRIRGNSNGRGGFTGGVMETTTKEARALARTAVTEVANEAALLTYRENPRIVNQVEIVSTLDSRTCPTCIAQGGKRYDVDSNFPKPAYHFSCRCFHVAVVDWAALGLEPPEEGTRAARDANGKTVQVPASTDYDQWLRGQPARVQDEVLGKGRAELFRSGRTDLAGLIRTDGRFVTLDELEKRLGPVRVQPRAPVVPKGPPQFTPAKTVAEGLQWAAANAADNVDYADLDLSVVNQINEGLYEMVVVNGYQRVDTISVAYGSHAYADAFAGHRIRIRSRTTVADRQAIDARSAERYEKLGEQRAQMIAKLRAEVAAGAGRATRSGLKKLEAAPLATRWTVGMATDKPWKATMIHEFGHIAHYRTGAAFFYRYQELSGISGQAFNSILKGNIGKEAQAAAAKISEYATTNAFEYFAEAWTAYHMGQKHLLRPGVISLIEEIIAAERNGVKLR